MRLSIKGRYQDTLISLDEEGNEIREVMPWRDNQVQDSALKIIAERVGNLSEQQAFEDYLPIKYMALGTGTSSAQAYTAETLETEVERIPADSFVFLDASGNTSATPTNKIRITVTLGAGQGNNNTLTEFGLVGGDATDVVNTGYLFNWVRHTPIVKTPLITIDRVVDITFDIDRS